MEIDYNDLLKISNLSGISQDKMIKIIYEFLIGKVPDWDTRGNNPYLLHKRLKFPLEILREILYLNYLEIQYAYDDEDIYQTRPVKYSVDLLRKLDLSELDFTGWDISNLDLSYTNAKINPQTVRDKSLQGTNCKGLDFSNVDFTDVDIEGANLEETGANIDPQTIKDKSLWETNCTSLNLRDKDFNEVYVVRASLEGTGASINPQTIKYKSLEKTNCTGLNFIGKDFTGVDIEGANLEETGANIDPQTIKNKSLKDANCTGLNFIGKDFTDVDIKGASLEGTGAHINPQKIRDKSLWGTNCKGLDFTGADFYGVSITNANLEDTHYPLPPVTIFENHLTNLILQNLEAFKKTIIATEDEIIISFDYKEKIQNMTKEEKKEKWKLICDFIMKKRPNWNIEDPIEVQKLNRIKLERELLQLIFIDTDFYRETSIDILRRLDLTGINFKEKNLMNLDLSYTNATIDPQEIYQKSLQGTNCKGLDLSYKSFFNVDVRGANLEDTNASLDPQEIYQKSLRGTNCKGLKFKTKTVYDFLGTIDMVNFNGVDIDGANLLETNVQLSTEKAIKGMNIRSLKKLGYSELEIKRYIRKRSRKI